MAAVTAERATPSAELGRGLDAIVLLPDVPAPPHRLVEQLRDRGVEVIALDRFDGPATLELVRSRLAERGIGSTLTLWLSAHGTVADPMRVVGDRSAVRHVLQEQLRRRRRRRVPSVDVDPAWTIEEIGADPRRRRVSETVLTLGAGGVATRGSVEEPLPDSVPMVLACGVYVGDGAGEHLLCGPGWTGLTITPPPAGDRRVLDMRTGVILREETHGEHPVRTLRFVSVTRPGVMAMRAEAATGRLRPGPALRPPIEGRSRRGRLGTWRSAQVSGVGGITAVAAQREGRDGDVRTVERVAAYVTGPHGAPPVQQAVPALAAALELGFDRLLAEHRAGWASRWAEVDVSIPDDPSTELALRFALFQLWCNTAGSGEAAVGARGISGRGYAGHVFWDADVFVLPAVASMDPAIARAMLEYRLRRLPAARSAARVAGFDGARFPWESTVDGRDVTPSVGDLGGVAVEIRTGRLEEHITADVAWAAVHYASWTGDHGFRRGPGRELLIETARYWESRCHRDAAGRAHIGPVIGPDEYHEGVEDNAFTNVMARWNLRAAAEQVRPSAPRTCARWRELAAALVDGYDTRTGRYEQFAGYFGLEPMAAIQVAPPPVAADVLLGQARVGASQLIKQPDVLMLHHLVPDEVAPGSLEPNLDFYGPRTTHGSSLSPAVSAALLARAGRAEEALRLLRIALRIDLDDLTGMTASGLHLAAMGGAWQAMLFGFVGAKVRNGVLHLDPRLPRAWPTVDVRFRCLGRRIVVRVTSSHVEVTTDAPVSVRLAGNRARRVVGSMRLDRREV